MAETTDTTAPADLSGVTQEGTSIPPTEVELRGQIIELVKNDLLGPKGGEEEEVRENRVSDRYVVGMLAPLWQRVNRDTDEELANGGAGSTEDGSTEPNTAPADTTLPSSLGLTFTVNPEVSEIVVQASWGRYERIDDEDEGEDEETGPENAEVEGKEGEEEKGAGEGSGKKKRLWRRHPAGGEIPPITLVEGEVDPIAPDDESAEITIRGRVRKGTDGWIVTLFLINGQTEPDRLKDEKWLFQVELTVESVDGSPIFVRRPIRRNPERMEEEWYRESSEMAMVYRRRSEFAVGHGVAVHAETPKGNPWMAHRLITRPIPFHEVEQQTPPTLGDPGFEILDGLELDMKVLAEISDGGTIVTKLNPLVAAYEEWIQNQEKTLDDPEERLEEHREAAKGVIERCKRALERIRTGIELLAEGGDPLKAFRFANHAMYQQRIRSIFSENKRRGEEASLIEIAGDPINHSWYPFQLAFILLNLPGVTALDHPDRCDDTEALLDLLWFPTGGGKTEAYLGIAAYVMALRRLEGEVAGRDGTKGVAIIMRYTLRLLTLQQFQRAATLICACEQIRRKDQNTWKEEPFRVGLWVGRRATPNWTDDSAEVVREIRASGGWFSSSGTPAQLKSCPWCGSEIDPGSDIEVEKVQGGRGRTLVFCGDPLGKCLFSRSQSPGEGLPVVVVDEEIYRLLPTLLIATVDKFAQMPWQGRVQMLFGRVDKYCPRHGFRSPEVDDENSHRATSGLPAVTSRPHPPLRPPDLIIQDELHLISGPLGSMVGIYETAVDELCAWEVEGKRVRPKVIASTATIRSAASQVNSVFLRRVEIFPPPGLSIDDNFFSILREPSKKHPGRFYIGVCAPGKRLKAVLIRVYLAFLAAAQKIYDEFGDAGKAVDPWMTAIGYFNSIRELSGMRRLVEDDVRTRLRGVERRGLGNRRIRAVEELTSRKGSTDIPDILDRLEVPFDPVEERRRRAQRGRRSASRKPVPYDVLLATNMISVGVDVKRLGLMIVAGQPKTTAEYIQATSRVGRHHPGIVCTVYNWARPRDLSHYERFEHYHATFYERVESLSVTPFAERALDRALSALFVSLVRLPGTDYNENATAGDVEHSHAFVLRAIDAIVDRAAAVTASTEYGNYVRSGLKQRLDEWLARANRDEVMRLGYRATRGGVTTPLLSVPSPRGWDTFTCLNSLRDVEPLSGFILVRDGLSSGQSSEV